jgi:UDP:flavonoid glycosyltransferase YjiC (YdhE family)
MLIASSHALDIAVFSLPEAGHLNAVTAVASALVRRGHRVSFYFSGACIRWKAPPPAAVVAGDDNCVYTLRDFVENRLPPGSSVVFDDTEIILDEKPLHYHIAEMKRITEANPLAGIYHLANLIQRGGIACASHLQKVWNEESLKPDIIVTDYFFPAGWHISELLSIPLIKVNPVVSLIVTDWFPVTYPNFILGRSVNSMRSLTGRIANLGESSLYLFIRAIDYVAVDKARAALGLRRKGFIAYLTSVATDDCWVVQFGSLGYEPPMPRDPRIFFVGAPVDSEDIGAALGAPRSVDQVALPEVAWLNDAARKEKVLYISLGSIAHPSSTDYKAILKAVDGLDFDLMFSVREETRNLLPESKDLPPGVATFPFVKQQAVLAHPSVTAFISHCGANSVLESLALGKPIVGLPLEFDQTTNCDYAFERGAALCLSPKQLSVPALRQAIVRISTDDTFQKSAARVASFFRFDGGTERAADVVELAAEVGTEMLAGWFDHSPLYARWKLDIIFFLAVSLFLVYLSLRRVFLIVRARFLHAPRGALLLRNKKE